VAARRKNSVSFGIAPGQPPSMNPLVGHGQIQPLLLCAVPQGGVVDVEAVVGHFGFSRLVLAKQKTPREYARGLRVGVPGSFPGR
jgi:hypothetical protein